MKILFDERWIGMHGIGRIAAEMRGYLLARQDVEYHAVTKGPKFSVWDLAGIPCMISRIKPDLYFSLGYNPPVLSGSPIVFTLCDLISLYVKEETRPLKTFYFNTFIRSAGRRAASILTISEYSRNEILEWGGFDEEKIRVVYPAAGPQFRPEGRVREAVRPYFLYVGNGTAHKNVERLIRGFGISGLDREFDLLLAGMEKGQWNTLISDLDLQNAVHQLGMLPDEELPAQYRGAYAFIFASLYEGFGLPPLEAMACGTPVIVSDRTSLPEVVGDAGMYVDPERVESIAEAMRKMAGDQDLHDELAVRGVQRSKMFSWEQATHGIWKVLVEAAGA